MRRLEGKTALVTGGARGIGKAIVSRLVAEGATVVICDVRDDQLQETVIELGGNSSNVSGLCVDVGDLERITAMLDDFDHPLDILVNNAGIAPRIDLRNLTPEDLDEVFRVNFRSAVFLSRAVGAAMCRAGSGSIVSISSVNAFRGQPEMLHYNTSKAALVSMTLTMAIEFAGSGVRVNCVCPGSTRTEVWEDGGWRESERREFADKIPMRRFAVPAEIAAGVAFLASDDASYITGQALVIDGGLTVRM